MSAPTVETDAVVVGAGPVGLFQVFQLGLQAIHAHVIDVLPHAGGQCAELYPDKPIYDIPAISVCTGRELTQHLLRQIEPFAPTFHFEQAVNSVDKQIDGRFLLETSLGHRFLTKTLFIAAGVGAFKPRAIPVNGIDKFVDRQLFYLADQATNLSGMHLLIVGGDEAALDQALHICALGADGLSHAAASVTMLHRRDVVQGDPAKVTRMRALCEVGAMRFVAGQIVGFEERDGTLIGVEVLGADDCTQKIAVDRMLVMLGLSPKLGPIAHWGLAMQRRQLLVDTEKFSTSEPGIFAVGDINTYAGKKKLILCGFHEATLAAYAAASMLFPEQRVAMQYTTTSPRLHKLLGVESSAMG